MQSGRARPSPSGSKGRSPASARQFPRSVATSPRGLRPGISALTIRIQIGQWPGSFDAGGKLDDSMRYFFTDSNFGVRGVRTAAGGIMSRNRLERHNGGAWVPAIEVHISPCRAWPVGLVETSRT